MKPGRKPLCRIEIDRSDGYEVCTSFLLTSTSITAMITLSKHCAHLEKKKVGITPENGHFTCPNVTKPYLLRRPCEVFHWTAESSFDKGRGSSHLFPTKYSALTEGPDQ